MKTNFLGVFFILGTAFLIGCGSGNTANSGNSANSNTNKANANANQATSNQTSNVDTTPMNVSVKDLNDKNETELKGLVGRTLVFKTEGVKNLGEESLTSSYVSRAVICKGDFSKFKDAIKTFQDKGDIVYADFKGVVDKVEEVPGSGFNITLKDCVLSNLEK